MLDIFLESNKREEKITLKDIVFFNYVSFKRDWFALLSVSFVFTRLLRCIASTIVRELFSL